jgi:hypothetical protein
MNRREFVEKSCVLASLIAAAPAVLARSKEFPLQESIVAIHDAAQFRPSLNAFLDNQLGSFGKAYVGVDFVKGGRECAGTISYAHPNGARWLPLARATEMHYDLYTRKRGVESSRRVEAFSYGCSVYRITFGKEEAGRFASSIAYFWEDVFKKGFITKITLHYHQKLKNENGG